jgi:hypothetical protein
MTIPGPNTVEDYQGPLPDGWTGGQSTMKWWRGKIMHLYKLVRPCAECGAEMRIDVSKAALIGTAKNAGLHLRRCAVCRARTKALNTSSRPQVEGESSAREVVAVEPQSADETLRSANATMKEELEGLYAQNRELRDRLAQYEPEPRMPWE